MLCLWRVRAGHSLVSDGGNRTWNENVPQSEMWISFFMVVISLGLFPLDCFIPSSGSSGALGRAGEQNIQTSCFETRIRINCPSNTAANEFSPNPSERVNPVLYTSQIKVGWVGAGDSRYSHKDTRVGKVLAQGHIASFWVTSKQWHV